MRPNGEGHVAHGEVMNATIERIEPAELLTEPAIMRRQAGVDLRAQISSELWNAAVRDEVVAEVKGRYERGEIDLSPERIARAMMGH